MRPPARDLYGGGPRPAELRLRVPSVFKTCRYAVQSIRLRWSRSLIAMACVAGAVAFLSYNLYALREASSAERIPVGLSLLQDTHPEDFFAGLERFTSERHQNQKRLFSVALSLLVAFVGIANAFLMAVKERFREIATLKCLGAVNRYIQRLFLIEALLLGLLGSLAGVLAGGILHGLTRENPAPWTWIFQVGIGAILLGVSLTLTASIGPIRHALAMMPVEALRVEE